MGAEFLDPGGIVVLEGGVTLRRVKELIAALHGPGASFASLIECRSATTAETVIFEVEVERPQIVANDIKKTERLAAVFPRDDESYPEVLALRSDFPVTQHQNYRFVEFPRSLCLYDRPWSDVRMTWTAATFIERVRWWLKRAARDELHADDQGLESFLPPGGNWLVLPAPKDPPQGEESFLVNFPGGDKGRVLVAHNVAAGAPTPGTVRFVVLRFETPKQRHRVMSRIPRTLADLADLLKSNDFDLLSKLRERLKEWPKEKELLLQHPVILLIDLPKSRRDDGPVESVEHRAVMTSVRLLDLGVAVGAWSLHDGKRAVLVAPDLSKAGGDVDLHLLNVCDSLTRDGAANLNGLPAKNDLKIFAVGAGSLGSHVALSLARAGFGRWTIADYDDLLPHNLARHALGGALLGCRKAEALAWELGWICRDAGTATFIDADVLRPGPDATRLRESAGAAELILDMSASIAVGRRLAAMDAPGRRASLFLSPSGKDLVLLAEDAKRNLMLDHVEMMYYVGVATDDRLGGHLDAGSEHVRYGLSCRDVSSRIAQDSVAALAGIAASALRQLANDERPRIQIWRLQDDSLSIASVALDVEPLVSLAYGEWMLQVAPAALRAIATWRRERLPNETGGVLMGRVDHDRRTIYLMLALPSPPDSREWPMQYIRGCDQLRQRVELFQERTALNLGYIGEWHSHPDGAPTLRSGADMKVFLWIGEHTLAEGKPPVMLIAGEHERARVFIGIDGSPVTPEELWIR